MQICDVLVAVAVDVDLKAKKIKLRDFKCLDRVKNWARASVFALASIFARPKCRESRFSIFFALEPQEKDFETAKIHRELNIRRLMIRQFKFREIGRCSHSFSVSHSILYVTTEATSPRLTFKSVDKANLKQGQKQCWESEHISGFPP